MLAYLLFCTVLVLSVKDGLSAIRYRYYFSAYCPEIRAMFSDEETFHQFAALDRNYLPKAQTTGIYQCYCKGKVSLLTSWKLLFDSQNDLSICKNYLLSFNGGKDATTAQGVLNAILNNAGIIMITKIVPKIGYNDLNIQVTVQIISIVVLCYYNIVVLPNMNLIYNSFVPRRLSAKWFEVYGKMVVMSLLITSFLPYMGILLNLIVNGVRCKKASDQYTKQYRMIRKNANILTTSFICFTYGFSMPILFLIGTVSILSQYLLDKVLVTYFYK